MSAVHSCTRGGVGMSMSQAGVLLAWRLAKDAAMPPRILGGSGQGRQTARHAVLGPHLCGAAQHHIAARVFLDGQGPSHQTGIAKGGTGRGGGDLQELLVVWLGHQFLEVDKDLLAVDHCSIGSSAQHWPAPMSMHCTHTVSAGALTQRLHAQDEVLILHHVALHVGGQVEADDLKEAGAVVDEGLCCHLDSLSGVVAAAIRRGRQAGGSGTRKNEDEGTDPVVGRSSSRQRQMT